MLHPLTALSNSLLITKNREKSLAIFRGTTNISCWGETRQYRELSGPSSAELAEVPESAVNFFNSSTHQNEGCRDITSNQDQYEKSACKDDFASKDIASHF